MIRRWTKNRVTPVELGLILTLVGIIIMEMASPFIK